MFCAKCGAQINETDQYCPKCGKENINYVSSGPNSVKKILGKHEPFFKTDVDNNKIRTIEANQQKKIPLMAIGVCAIAVVLACVFFIGLRGGESSVKDNSRITYSPKGLEGYVGENGSVFFVENGNVRTIEGKTKEGKSTPDRTRFIVVFENGDLVMYGDPESEPIQISKSADSISAVTNSGCFFINRSNEKLYYYDFETQDTIDVGMDNSSHDYSVNYNTVIGQGKNNEVRIFTVGDTESRVLFNAETANNIEDLCCMADNGSNLVWTIQEGSTFNIYMMKNDAPERIGKITNAEKYSIVSGLYYNNDHSFIVYSNGSAQMILGNNGEIREISLPGVKNGGSFYNTKGEFLSGNDDYIEEPYFILSKTKSSTTGGLYRLLKDGTVQLEADGVNLENTWSYSLTYYIRDGYFYFIDRNNDLCKKKLGEGNEVIPLTTDIRAFYIPREGGYAYIVKAGSLYMMNLSDNNSKLDLIWNGISEDDSFYLTDKKDTVYFVTNMQEISDSYRHKGTLYQYTVGGEAKQIVNDVMYLVNNGERSISADAPVIERYVSHEKYDYIINVGTCIEGDYLELIHHAKD